MNKLNQTTVLFYLGFLVLSGLSNIILAQPTYTHNGNQTVEQNTNVVPSETIITAWATGINATNPQFNITSISLNGSLTFEAGLGPQVDPVSGDLSFTLTPNTSGFATFNVQLQDSMPVETSSPSTIRLDVEFINAAPSFTVDELTIIYNEKAGYVEKTGWAKNISPGPNPLENSQEVSFVTTIESQDPFISFDAFPKVDKFGNFSFEATGKSNGNVYLKIYLEDNGESNLPNNNQSEVFDVVLTINPINDAPTFIKGENIIVGEHDAVVTDIPWATNISAGAPDEEESQELTFVLTQTEISDEFQFDVPPAIDANGNISFEVAPHNNGFAIYELVLTDDGIDSPFPNKNTSTVQAFTITVNYINDPPSFDKGEDIIVEEGDIVSVFENWATNISPGESPNEQEQEIYFTVNFTEVSGSLAFLLAPQIDPNGTLSFRTTEHTFGEATMEIFLSDDGELASPHNNTSQPQSLKITVEPVNFPPDDIRLSKDFLLEKQPVGSEVGELATSDLDPEDEHNYALVEGEGSDGNEFFSIEGNILVANVSFNWDESDLYSVRIKSSDGEFSIEESFDITILKFIEGIKFANAITPNGDGNNDTWELEDIDAFPDALVHIYDKAGLTVYKSSGGYTPWDGKNNGKQLPMGTYYYVIDLRNGSPIYNGTLTIIL